ncbi:hypothetical protein NQ317_014022 [Molorchus minor]|uniref:Reverse transcriptase/retrotransposon-derived protein RNase H-like domain-containing protein n=1 Tax=Molorchus minor TaxID=1323400 RepID=A0ABQ9J3M4_9CUCU|nr:hypothetical protein NQ317_014022 [Molorchus minor]
MHTRDVPNVPAKEVNFLGHVVSSDKTKTDPEKMYAVRDWSRPSNIHEFPSFLDIAKPLHRLLKEKIRYQWTPERETSFKRLKAALCTSPVLVYSHGIYIFYSNSGNSGVV